MSNQCKPSPGDLENLRFALPLIHDAVRKDRSRFFNLTAQVIDRYSERRWEAVISDANRGVVVGEFISYVLHAVDATSGTPPIKHIPIANSRLVGDTRRSERIHSKAVTRYLGNTGLQNVLLVTDTVDSGKSMRRLIGSVVHAGIRADIAVLSSALPNDRLRAKMQQPKDSELYATDPTTVEVATVGDTIVQGIGLITVVGNAEPQPSPYAWPLVGQAVRQQYRALADEYVAQR